MRWRTVDGVSVGVLACAWMPLADRIRVSAETVVMFDGEVFVHYGFVRLEPIELGWELQPSFGGQVNGLLQAAEPGLLQMSTGLHTGMVPVRVELLDVEPAVDEAWEEVVEASFTTTVATLQLAEFQDAQELPPLPAEGTFRARYSAIGMDAASRADTRMDDEPALDRYLLQLWPAPAAPDRVLRQTSKTAAYWHRTAQSTPPPSTPEERADRAQVEQAQRDAREAEDQLRRELAELGGSPPSDALRVLGYEAAAVARRDRSLADLISELSGSQQRQIAAWAARWISSRTGLGKRDWVAVGLDALDRGDPLPPPLNDWRTAFDRYADGERVVTVASLTVAGDEQPKVTPTAAALAAVLRAGDPDPGAAAFGALKNATDPSSTQAAMLAAAHSEIWRRLHG